MSTETPDDVPAARVLRSALFVDFDNVYSGLRQLDPEAAEAFATNPGHLVQQLETVGAAHGLQRRFLVRRCYLNPAVYARFRPFFTRAGFRVVDCPSLTQQGKSSADINLVLDAVEALALPTYDEFIIASGDADFTPLAERCRAADRRVAVIAAGPTASAYRAVADVVIAADQLAEMVTPDEPAESPAAAPSEAVAEVAAAPVPSAPASDTTRSAAADAVMAVLRSADGPVYSPTVAQAAQRADAELQPANWGGHGSFAVWLKAAVPQAGYASRPVPGFVWDAERFTEDDLPDEEERPAVELTELQLQVARVTETPKLPADHYRAVYAALAEDLAHHTFRRNETIKRVRDMCTERGKRVSRAQLNFIVQGLLYAKGSVGPDDTADELAAAAATNVLQLCRTARMELSPQDEAAIHDWVSGRAG